MYFLWDLINFLSVFDYMSKFGSHTTWSQNTKHCSRVGMSNGFAQANFALRGFKLYQGPSGQAHPEPS